MALLIKAGIVAATGLAGWFAGFFSSDSIKNLSWFAVLAGIAAVVIALVIWLKK